MLVWTVIGRPSSTLKDGREAHVCEAKVDGFEFVRQIAAPEGSYRRRLHCAIGYSSAHTHVLLQTCNKFHLTMCDRHQSLKLESQRQACCRSANIAINALVLLLALKDCLCLHTGLSAETVGTILDRALDGAVSLCKRSSPQACTLIDLFHPEIHPLNFLRESLQRAHFGGSQFGDSDGARSHRSIRSPSCDADLCGCRTAAF